MMVNKIASRRRFCSREALVQFWGGAVSPREDLLDDSVCITVSMEVSNP